MFKEAAIIFGLSIPAGAAIGVAAESYTNEVAIKKIRTVEECFETTTEMETVVTKEFEKCVEGGVFTGAEIGVDVFDKDDPVRNIALYLDAQRNEASAIEPGRIAGWAFAPSATVFLAGVFLVAINA